MSLAIVVPSGIRGLGRGLLKRPGRDGMSRSCEPVAETSLLQRVAAGDAAAVNECVDRYGGLVWSLARKMCAQRADAEDAVQDVFISLWRSADRYDPSIAAEATFVAMIARRRLIDRVRRKSRRVDTASIEGAGPVVDTSDDGNTALAGLATDEERSAAEGLLSELSEEQQRVLRLSIMYGLSHEKISAATDLPLGTVKTHIRRGLIRAKKILAERGEAGVGGAGRDTEVAR